MSTDRAAWEEEREFVDSIWPTIRTTIDATIFGVDTSKAGVEFALKLAADIAVSEWRKRDSEVIS